MESRQGEEGEGSEPFGLEKSSGRRRNERKGWKGDRRDQCFPFPIRLSPLLLLSPSLSLHSGNLLAISPSKAAFFFPFPSAFFCAKTERYASTHSDRHGTKEPTRISLLASQKNLLLCLSAWEKLGEKKREGGNSTPVVLVPPSCFSPLSSCPYPKAKRGINGRFPPADWLPHMCTLIRQW